MLDTQVSVAYAESMNIVDIPSRASGQDTWKEIGEQLRTLPHGKALEMVAPEGKTIKQLRASSSNLKLAGIRFHTRVVAGRLYLWENRDGAK